MVHDLGVAEELAQDALVAALEQWPGSGVPRNPGAWLMTTAKRRAIDQIRRNETYARKLRLLGHELETEQRTAAGADGTVASVASVDAGAGGADGAVIEDDLLRLVFIACHPVLSREARVALTLRLLGGLTTDEIARAFLVAESTVAQRIVRAKRTLAKEKVPFEVPEGPELGRRLASVLEVVYLIFNEGYSATAGEDWMRPGLCEDAVRLGRVLAGLLPGEPEVHGLVALLEIQASRVPARTAGPGRAPVLLLDQDRTRWDQLLIRRGFAALARADAAARERGEPPGSYALQAAVAVCHARAVRAEDTDWERIVALYDLLAARDPSPVVQLNRAVAVSMWRGPEEALALVERLAAESPALRDYHLLPSVRGDLLSRTGRYGEAAEEFGRAAGLTRNGAESAFLLERAEGAASAGAAAGRGDRERPGGR
ncbi:RNA polymerase sigma factor [Streptomyces sp. CA-111067]|uniref:RNA polymerase sigma factor n=1 Tax=Streptomyces sp. CA-111067 TaxID=3240046 RepID=UPI003D97AD13